MTTKMYCGEELIGKKIRLTTMPDDPDPVPAGSTGVVVSFTDFGGRLQLGIDWDIHRSLFLVCPPDTFEVID